MTSSLALRPLLVPILLATGCFDFDLLRGVPDGGSGGGGDFATGGGDDLAQCVPSGADLPDDQFADTNCDGIDGDASQALFVDPVNGDDGNDGSRENPLKHLSVALQEAIAANGAKRQILVASGDIVEPQTVFLPGEIAGAGYGVWGGYDAAWNRSDANARPRVRGPSRAVAAVQLAQPVVWDRVDVRSATPGAPGASSYAFTVALSGDKLAVSHAQITAGSGAAGGPPPVSIGALPGIGGGPGGGVLGGNMGQCVNGLCDGALACPAPIGAPPQQCGNNLLSGAGGTGAPCGAFDGQPGVPVGNGGGGPGASPAMPGGPGQDGAPGSPGAGGDGAGGGQGGQGGHGGPGGLNGAGGLGGHGGRGGDGGPGGGGGGGPTICVAVAAGVAPALDQVTCKLGTPGAGGQGGPNGKDGLDGVALELK